MRQTIVKDGVQLRLQDLLGSEYNESSTYSVQDNMIENISRVCKAIVGNSSNGKVMSGMSIDKDKGWIHSGYAITPNGKVIKFGNTRYGSEFDTFAASSRVNVYAKYIQEFRSPGAQGGVKKPIIRMVGEPQIVKDQVGHTDSSDSDDGNDQCVVYNTGAVSLPSDDCVYVGTIIIGANNKRSVLYPEVASSDVQYIYNAGTHSNLLWTSTQTSMSGTAFTNTVAKMMIDKGKNNLKKLVFTLRNRMTSVQRVSNTDYNMQIDFIQYDSLHGQLGVSTRAFVVPDAVNPISKEFDVNEMLKTDCQFLAVKAYIPYTTGVIFTDSSGYVDVQYIIEKLN